VSYIIAILTAGSLVQNLIGGVSIVLLFCGWWLFDRYRQQRYSVRLELRSPAPAKGLILLISPYRTRVQGEDFNQQFKLLSTPNQATKESDFTLLDLEQSNLKPQLRAIAYHHKTLQEVWLICSEQSFAAGNLLREYVRVVYGERITVHHHESYTVNPYFDDQLCRVAENIFASSDIKPRAMIADITGGLATMSVSLAMACVAPGRRMQYMEAPRDERGEPLMTSETAPIELDYDPVLHWDFINPQNVD
jgi:hypothetical protein